MDAIMLAAGIGKRLGLVQQSPKCLIRIGKKSLLQRHIENLQRLGVEHMVLCTGFRAEEIKTEVHRLGADAFCKTVFNPDFEKGSVVSLWQVRAHLKTGADVLLMDADVLYDYRVIERLYNGSQSNLFLLDRDFEAGDEPVKLCIAGSHIVEFRKLINADLSYDFAGESVGFFRFDSALAKRLAERTEHYVDQGLVEQPYEEAIRDLLLETPQAFDYSDITGLAWIEIDFPEDVKSAEQIARSRLQESHDE